MPTPLTPQEVYLLERYSSLEYFVVLRDEWTVLVRHVERCLEAFTERLPVDYRDRQLPDQPDIVWGERVLPNFRSTQKNLDRACMHLGKGELRALGAAWGVIAGHRGQIEFWAGWMDEPQVAATLPGAKDTYYQLLNAPQVRAWNIARTHDRVWSPGALGTRYDEASRGPLDPPERWPMYQLNQEFRAKMDERVPRNGIYLPDADNSCAAALAEDDDWLDCKVLTGFKKTLAPGDTGHAETPVTEWRPTGWTLIERVPGETIPFEEGLGPIESRPQRVPAGQKCPRAGWWYTPAKPGPRRFFSEGDLFPRIEDSDYGDTFWIWSPEQSPPEL